MEGRGAGRARAGEDKDSINALNLIDSIRFRMQKMQRGLRQRVN